MHVNNKQAPPWFCSRANWAGVLTNYLESTNFTFSEVYSPKSSHFLKNWKHINIMGIGKIKRCEERIKRCETGFMGEEKMNRNGMVCMVVCVFQYCSVLSLLWKIFPLVIWAVSGAICHFEWNLIEVYVWFGFDERVVTCTSCKRVPHVVRVWVEVEWLNFLTCWFLHCIKWTWISHYLTFLPKLYERLDLQDIFEKFPCSKLIFLAYFLKKKIHWRLTFWLIRFELL